MFRAPTTKVNTSAGENLVLPLLSTHAVGTLVAGQGPTLAGSDPVFTNLTLNAFKYGQLVKVSNELIDDAAFDVAEFLGRDLGRSLGRVIDTDLTVGSGANRPRGIMTAAAAAGAGSITTGGSLITPTAEKLVDLVYGINDAYRANGAAGWLMKDSTAGTLRKLRDGAGGTVGSFLWEPSMAANTPDRLLGYPVFTDPNVAAMGSNARIAAFADMSAYYVRQVGNPVIELDRSIGFTTDETFVRGKHRIDGDLVDLNAITSIVQNA
jgi:HK97 family phage major capsid protein